MRPITTIIQFALAAILSAAPLSTWAFCFEAAGRQYGISPEILYNIANVESRFNPAAVGKNKNGTYDYGLMQINSIWEKTLGPERWAALSEPCTNVMTAAWILSQCFTSYGYTWKGIGCYNSRTPQYNRKYAQKIYTSIVKNRLAATSTGLTPAETPAGGDSPWEVVFRNDPR